MRSRQIHILMVVVVLVCVVVTLSVARAQMSHTTRDGTQPAPIRATMAELHAHGGVPAGWTFLMPPGNAAQGRTVFIALECFACHEVKGEAFPRTARTQPDSGPALTAMGAHHPAEYFAESIVNPNRVIVQGAGFTGPDGLSKMPSYADTMTLKQFVDVVAYLKSLTGEETAHDHGMGGAMKMDGSKTDRK